MVGRISIRRKGASDLSREAGNFAARYREISTALPPWQNTVVWVRQDRQLAMLLISPRQRRALRAVLTGSGFGVKEDRRSLAHGRAVYEP